MIEVVSYKNEHKSAWDQLVKNSKNGTFLFLRDYMDYHSDRFEDASLLFYYKGALTAVLPASHHDEMVTSHGGLTYGGIVCTAKMTMVRMLETFRAMMDHYRESGLKILRYKAIPTIYHRQPSQEDLYALFRVNAKLHRVDVSTSINLNNPISLSKGRKHSVSKARRAGVSLKCSDDFKGFWGILEEALSTRYGVKPTHSLDEIKLLASRFPEQIVLHGAYLEDQILAGVVVFDCGQVIHTQYLGVNNDGRDVGALDLVLHHLIKEKYASRSSFDFGISTEEQGECLNEGLIAQKEMFGGRAVVHQFFEIDLRK